MFQNIPYDPQADPNRNIALMVQNLLAPLLQQHQLRQQQGDIGRLRPFAQGDMQGPLPQTKTPFGQDILTQILFNQRQQADFARQPWWMQGAGPEATQQYRNRQLGGQPPKKARTIADVIGDISRVQTAYGKTGEESPRLQADLGAAGRRLHDELVDMQRQQFPEAVGAREKGLFDEVMEGQPKYWRTGAFSAIPGLWDRAYGRKAYKDARKKYIKQAADRFNISPRLAGKQFDNIWLQKYEAEAGQTKQKYASLSAAQGGERVTTQKGDDLPTETRSAISPLTEFDPLWPRLSEEQKKGVWQLEGYWQDLPPEEQREILTAMRNDPANITEILRILNRG